MVGVQPGTSRTMCGVEHAHSLILQPLTPRVDSTHTADAQLRKSAEHLRTAFEEQAESLQELQVRDEGLPFSPSSSLPPPEPTPPSPSIN